MKVFSPKINHLADLLYAAEEQDAEVCSLAWYLLGRDPLTGPLLSELLMLAADAQIKVGSQHWSLSVVALNQQVDRLLSADGRIWKIAADLLDPDREIGTDHAGLIAVLDARICRFRGDSSRMRRLRRRLIRDLEKEWGNRKGLVGPSAEAKRRTKEQIV